MKRHRSEHKHKSSRASSKTPEPSTTTTTENHSEVKKLRESGSESKQTESSRRRSSKPRRSHHTKSTKGKTKSSKSQSLESATSNNNEDSSSGSSGPISNITSEDESNEFEEEEEESYDGGSVEFNYEGEKNINGEPEGQGTLIILPHNIIYKGSFKNGEKCGQGIMTFPDGTRLEGEFREDEMNGQGRFIHADGSSWSGKWTAGELVGNIECRDETGKLWYCGHMRDGDRYGLGTLYYDEGATLYGKWKNGKIHGEGVYTYPDGSQLRGKWSKGQLESAKYYLSAKARKPFEATVYSFDPSSSNHLAHHPLRRDPYEERHSYAAPAIDPASGEGLFALCDLKKGTIAAFYNGLRLSLKKEEKRHWDLNGNVLYISHGRCVDIPSEFASTSVYCASLGHKANHSFTPNAVYVPYYDHPIFGRIKCIQTITDVKKGEEIFCNYDYKHGTGPTWYRNLVARLYPDGKPPTSNANKAEENNSQILEEDIPTSSRVHASSNFLPSADNDVESTERSSRKSNSANSKQRTTSSKRSETTRTSSRKSSSSRSSSKRSKNK